MLGALELRRRAKAAASKRESFCRPHGNAVPVAVIETLDVFVVPFNEVPERFAYDEGEGRSIAGLLEGGSPELL
jgi:hypothetical protein